jgi:predicted DNA-binding protein
MEKKHPITVVLKKETHGKLKEMAKYESRPVAQMARVIIERAVND